MHRITSYNVCYTKLLRPNFGLVRTLMVGLKNGSSQIIRGEVWFNELRLSVV